MAAATATIIAGGSALLGAGLSIKQAIDAKKAQDKADQSAQRAIADLKKIEYTDTFADVQVPTLGAQLEFEQQQQALKEGVQALREQGATGALGGVTELERQRSAEALQTAARLEQQEAALELAREKAEQDINIRNVGLQADILSQEALGAGQAAADASAAYQAGIQGTVGSLGLLAGVAQEAEGLYPEEERAARRDARRARKSASDPGTYLGAGGTDSRMRGTGDAFGQRREPFAGVGRRSSLYTPFSPIPQSSYLYG